MQKNLTNSTCRICLKDSEIFNSLFDEAEGFNLKFSELLDNFGDIKIDSNDMYPKYICVECTNELLITVKFHEKYRRTQEILSHFVTEEICEDYDDHREESELVVLQPSNDGNDEIVKESQFNNYDDDNDDNNIVFDVYFNGENHNKIKNDYKTKNLIEKELNETNPSYIIFDINDLGEDINLEIEKSRFDDIKKISDDQILYDRIVNAANAVVNKQNNNITHNTENKPQIINCNCDVCGAGFTHINNLHKHFESHGISEIYECGICLWPFTKFNKLKSHCYIDHSKIINYNENSIEYDNDEKHEILSSDAEFKDIVQLNIKKEPPSENSLTENISKINEVGNTLFNQKDIKKNHYCAICKRNFLSKSALLSHERTHTGDRPYKCTECQKSFTTQGGLALHTRRHTGFKPFVCNTCGKGFVESSNLKVHIRSHSGEKPHKCTICGRGFSRVFLLQLHLRTHTGEKPFHCPWCEKKFAQQGDLASHKRIHTGERPHKCPHCEKCFIKSSALNVHIRKHFKLNNKKKVQQRKTLDDEIITGDINEDFNQQDNSNLHKLLNSNRDNESEIMVVNETLQDNIVAEINNDIKDFENNRICMIEDLDPLSIA